jgi:hypothetical protein
VKKRIFSGYKVKNRIRQKSVMNAKASPDSSTTQRPESPDAPVEIKIPQRMVNLPVMPSKKLLRKIALLFVTAMALVAGGYFYSFLQH